MISEVLKSNSTLTSLNLGGDIRKKERKKEKYCNHFQMIMEVWTGNNIGDEGCIVIIEALKYNNSLTGLNLYCDKKRNMKMNWW